MKHCPICDWPLKERLEDGCIEGNCSYRPAEGTSEYHRIRLRRADLKRCDALEARVLRLEEMLSPSKVHGDSWSISVGTK